MTKKNILIKIFIINYFRNRKSIIEINGEKTEDEVFEDIKKAIS
jgi:adenylate kinase family enzyme